MSKPTEMLSRVLMPVILLLGMAGIPTQAQVPPGGLLQALEAEISALFDANRQCVVRIHTIYGDAGEASRDVFGNGYTHGTGFLIDTSGHVLTVDKAVSGGQEIRVTLADGSVLRAALVASDPTSDVAVVKTEEPVPYHVAFGDSDRARIGHYTFILGNAFGQLLPSIGTVYEVTEAEDLIQITSSVYPSYGGAPVFDSGGRVMGMVWAAPLYAQDRAMFGGMAEVPTSVFVIPINRARRIATALIERGQVTYGWLGVEVDRESHPVAVTRVAEDGPAWRAGIRAGDRIVAYAGTPVAGPFHLERLVMETPPGESIPIRVKRESITVATEAEVAGRPASGGDNPYGQLVGMDRTVVPVGDNSAGVQMERDLFEQIQTLEREIGRLRSMMQGK